MPQPLRTCICCKSVQLPAVLSSGFSALSRYATCVGQLRVLLRELVVQHGQLGRHLLAKGQHLSDSLGDLGDFSAPSEVSLFDRFGPATKTGSKGCSKGPDSKEGLVLTRFLRLLTTWCQSPQCSYPRCGCNPLRPARSLHPPPARQVPCHWRVVRLSLPCSGRGPLRHRPPP